MRQGGFPLETLHEHLGRPAWFWPLVFVLLLVLWGLACAAAPDVECT